MNQPIDHHAQLAAAIRSAKPRAALDGGVRMHHLREQIDREYRDGRLSDGEQDDLLSLWGPWGG